MLRGSPRRAPLFAVCCANPTRSCWLGDCASAPFKFPGRCRRGGPRAEALVRTRAPVAATPKRATYVPHTHAHTRARSLAHAAHMRASRWSLTASPCATLHARMAPARSRTHTPTYNTRPRPRRPRLGRLACSRCVPPAQSLAAPLAATSQARAHACREPAPDVAPMMWRFSATSFGGRW